MNTDKGQHLVNMMGLGGVEGLAGLAGVSASGAMPSIDALSGVSLAGGLGAATLADLNAQALLAGLPGSLQHMVPPIAPLQGVQTEAQTIDALQQAILATINTGGGNTMPNLFAALHTLGAEQVPNAAAAAAATATVPSAEDDDADQSAQPSGGRRSRRRGASELDEGDDDNRTLASTREKNRLAQRRFREKQKSTITEQRERLDAMSRQLDDYKREVQLLREENNILRAKLEGRATLHQHMVAQAPM